MNTPPRVLIVEDNLAVLRIIASILQRMGLETLAAHDGMEGLQAAHREQPDLIILDIVMPRLDGYQVCRLLQNMPQTASIPVLMVTAKGCVEGEKLDGPVLKRRLQEQLEGYEVGAADFMSKPIKAQELEERVKRLLCLARTDPVRLREDKISYLRAALQRTLGSNWRLGTSPV